MKTIINTDINRSVVGYMVNTGLSLENQQAIRQLGGELSQQQGQGIWVAPPDSLHITLMDWLAPLVDYGADKEHLFTEINAQYRLALRKSLRDMAPIEVEFDELKASASAIFLKGSDRGQFNDIRHQFLSQIQLLPGTKPPPTIIHFTIARFTDGLDLVDIDKVINGKSLRLHQTVNNFRLVKETKVPMLEYTVLENYQLG